MSTATRTSASTGGLAVIARELRSRAAERPTHAKLPRGLEIVMERCEGRWRLALGREQVSPSDEEVEICRRSFNVPEGAEEWRRTKTSTHPKTGRARSYVIVGFCWVER